MISEPTGSDKLHLSDKMIVCIYYACGPYVASHADVREIDFMWLVTAGVCQAVFTVVDVIQFVLMKTRCWVGNLI